jgi:hypothetical protein
MTVRITDAHSGATIEQPGGRHDRLRHGMRK